MGVYEVKMKTHSSTNVTELFSGLNNCVVHNCQPVIYKLVYGSKRYTCYRIQCQHPDCDRSTSEEKEVVSIWNKWNPKNENL